MKTYIRNGIQYQGLSRLVLSILRDGPPSMSTAEVVVVAASEGIYLKHKNVSTALSIMCCSTGKRTRRVSLGRYTCNTTTKWFEVPNS